MAGGKGKSSGGKSSGGKTSVDGPKKQQSHSARAGLQVSRVVDERHMFLFLFCLCTIPRALVLAHESISSLPSKKSYRRHASPWGSPLRSRPSASTPDLFPSNTDMRTLLFALRATATRCDHAQTRFRPASAPQSTTTPPRQRRSLARIVLRAPAVVTQTSC
jgi:hypothetical protein